MEKSLLANKLVKSLKDDSIIPFAKADNFKDVASWTSTGSPSLDLQLKTFGVPSGIIEIRGKSRSGKTTLSLGLVKNFMDNNPDNGVACVLSVERRDSRSYAKKMGINVDKLLLAKCSTVEDVFNKVQNIVQKTNEIFKEEQREHKPKFIFIWDSLGASISSQEMNKLETNAEKNDEEGHRVAMGATARALNRGLRFITASVFDKDITFIIINRAYNNIKTVGSKSYGGDGIEYAPNLRIEITRKEDVKSGDEIIGQISTFKVLKSDYNSILEKIDFEIYIGRGIVLSENDIQLGMDAGLISIDPEKKSVKTALNGKIRWNTKRKFYEQYDENPKFMKVLTSKITKYAHEKVIEERKIYENDDSKSISKNLEKEE